MGWYVLSEASVCNEAAKCDHADCASIVALAESECEECGKPIGWDTKYYFAGNHFDGTTDRLEHFACYWERIEREEKERLK